MSVGNLLRARKSRLMTQFVFLLQLAILFYFGNAVELAPVLDVREFPRDPCADPLGLVSDSDANKIIPSVVSVRPNATTGKSVVLEVEIENSASLLDKHDILVSWTSSKDSKSDRTFDSRRFRAMQMPGGNLFAMILEARDPEANVTGTALTLAAKQAMRMKPLWQRTTFFFVRLLSRNTSACQFTSAPSVQHAEWPAPCKIGEYLHVLGRDWHVHGSGEIGPSDFLDFIYQPVRADDKTVVCKPCPTGLDCAQNPDSENPIARLPAVGFHGGYVVKAGYWRVDWSPDAENAAVRCRNLTACAYGGRCLNGSHRAGPKCETCELGYGMRNGACVSCDHQDLTPFIVIASILFIFAIVSIMLRKQLVELRFIWRDIARIVKVVIDTMQIMSSMPEVLGGIDWPDELLVMFTYLDLSALDITQFLGLACIGQKEATFYARSGVLLGLLSIVFVGITSAYQFGNWNRKRWWNNKATTEEKEEFMKVAMEEVFEMADIDDNGRLDFDEVEEVARLIGNKKVKEKLTEEMKKKVDSATDKENTNVLSKSVWMHRREFVEYMVTIDDIESVALKTAAKYRLREIMTIFAPFLLILHTPVTARIFELFTCDRIGGNGGADSGGFMIRSTGEDIYKGGGALSEWDARKTLGFLPGDYKLPCMDFSQKTNYPEVSFFYIACFLFLIVVTIGFPSALMFYMCDKRKKFYTFAVYSEIGFLYERFKRGHEFADMHILIYKTMLCGFIVFLQPWPSLQRIVALSISIVYLTWFAWTKPMRNENVTKVCLYGFCSTTFMYMSMQIFAAANTGVNDAIRMLFIVLIVASCIGLLIAGGLAMMINLQQAKSRLSTLRGKSSNKNNTATADIGQLVTIKLPNDGTICNGEVEFIGPVPEREEEGIFYGVKLSNPIQDGHDGQGLFQCEPKTGIFVKANHIVEILKPDKITKSSSFSGKSAKARLALERRRFEKQKFRRQISRTTIVPMSESEISNLSPEMMEQELRKLQKYIKAQNTGGAMQNVQQVSSKQQDTQKFENKPSRLDTKVQASDSIPEDSALANEEIDGDLTANNEEQEEAILETKLQINGAELPADSNIGDEREENNDDEMSATNRLVDDSTLRTWGKKVTI